MTNLQTSPHPTLLRPTPPLHPAQSHLATPLPSLAPSAPLRPSHTSLMAADCQVSEFPSNPQCQRRQPAVADINDTGLVGPMI